MNKSLKLRLAAIPAVLIAMVGTASAAVPADVTTAIADANTDSLVVATAVTVIIVGIFSIKLLRKAL